MVGTLTVASTEVVEGTIKAGVRTAFGGGKIPSSFMYYHSGVPTASTGFVSTTTETTLVTLDVRGFKHFCLQLHNRDDENIDGGGANVKDIDLFIDGSNDPDFGACVVPILDNVTYGEGTETTIHFGEGIRGWVDTAGTPINYDYDGTSLVTTKNEGFPYGFLQLGLQAETEDSPAFFELWMYAL